jgi:hypothetical protein
MRSFLQFSYLKANLRPTSVWPAGKCLNCFDGVPTRLDELISTKDSLRLTPQH